MKKATKRLAFRAPNGEVLKDSIRSIVKLSREGLGITQRELAIMAGVSQRTISNFERGMNSRSGGWLVTVIKILKALDLEVVVR